MKKIGVIGAGVIGSGVAENFAEYGYQVTLVDNSTDSLEKSRKNIHQNLRFLGALKKKVLADSPDAILGRIFFTGDYDSLADVDFVVENVTEDLMIKKSVYETLERVCKRESIFLVNTSCISITKIASFTTRAPNIMGAHFMNPVPLKNFVECIRGYHTSEVTIAATKDLLKSLEKDCVVVNDLPGFVSNRISHLFMNEAAFVVQDQVAEARQVDDIFKKCFSHKMGPLETADLIGIDTVVNSLDILYESFQDSKFRCCPLLRKMVDAGSLGRKTGKGFYNYS